MKALLIRVNCLVVAFVKFIDILNKLNITHTTLISAVTSTSTAGMDDVTGEPHWKSTACDDIEAAEAVGPSIFSIYIYIIYYIKKFKLI